MGEQSGIKLRSVVPRISWLLLKGFFWRLREKYVIRDFHPLVFFYALGILMTSPASLLGAIEAILRLNGNAITTPTIVLVALLLISGSQFTLFAMWFDMESNKDLRWNRRAELSRDGRSRRARSEPAASRLPPTRGRRRRARRAAGRRRSAR